MSQPTERDLIRRSAARWAEVAEQEIAELQRRTPEQDERDLRMLFAFARRLEREHPDPEGKARDEAEDLEWRLRWADAMRRVAAFERNNCVESPPQD